MAKSKIQWTEHSVNPVVGCNRVSKGCDHCYAMMMAARLEAMGQRKYAGLTKRTSRGIDWSGKINFDLEALLKEVKRKTPTMFFVPSMGDLFHKDVPFEFIDKVFALMIPYKQHTFQVLTKRLERVLEYFANGSYKAGEIGLQMDKLFGLEESHLLWSGWPFLPPNVWLGGSVEDQKTADERIPLLLQQTPIKVKWLSVEPLLGEIDLLKDYPTGKGSVCYGALLDWVVVGCESGIRKRECKLEWIESIVGQCKEANVPVFVKQINIDGEVIKDIERFPKHLQIREYPERKQ